MRLGSLQSCASGLLANFLNVVHLVDGKHLIVVLIMISLITSKLEYLLICLKAIYISFSVTNLDSSFVLFFFSY